MQKEDVGAAALLPAACVGGVWERCALAHYQPLLEAYGSDGVVSTQPRGSGPETWQWQGSYALGDGYNLQLQVISVTRGGYTSRVEIYLS